ncbi:hypothetical protein DPMN_068456 [Dreissena polymorpha]|uniref:Uncharacterized protein n=1 Tax=Dreissena polymorpha TaxID=45954 RepID=A0A9D3Z1N1_DREPO|nr:hypothetical protein DPMN_068456 [Dreissena polymorpha]
MYVRDFLTNIMHSTSTADYPTKAVVKDQVLVHELRRHFLTYDPANRRFNIQGILRECLKTFFALRHIPGNTNIF